MLEDYQRWRRLDATAMALGMDGLNRLFSDARSGVQAIRNAGLGAMAGSGPARRFFMQAASGTGNDMPRLLRGLRI